MKKRKSTMAKKFFVVGTVMLWFIIVVFSLYVLKVGGHLKPKAAGVENTGFNVSGLVSFDGKGVISAKITAAGYGANNYTYTDSSGNFSFEGLFGTYALRIEKEGYKPAEVNVVAQDGEFQNIALFK